MASNVIPQIKGASSKKGAESIVENTIKLWQALTAELVPIIGKDGFSMLFSRSLFLTRVKYDWLPTPQVLENTDSQFEALKISLDNAAITNPSRGSLALLTAFIDILTTLIGEPLTSTIIQTAWGDIASVILARTFNHE